MRPVLAGCGGDESSSAAPVAVAGGAEALQRQFVDVVDHVSPQVVQIQTSVGLGSGIVYDDRGDIVTNAHVTGSARKFLVTLSDGDRHTATLVGSDPSNDLAVIRLSRATPTPATFANSSGVRSGDIVFAIGNPLGLQSSITQGIVSSLNRSVGEGNGVTLKDVIQTSAEINPGNRAGRWWISPAAWSACRRSRRSTPSSATRRRPASASPYRAVGLVPPARPAPLPLAA